MIADRLVRDPATRWRSCLDGVVVMSPEATEPLFLTTPGDEIWHLLATPRTLTELADELEARFAGDTVAAETEAFVFELERLGLVRR